MNGKRVLVTGATAGLGKQTALELMQLNAELIIVGRNPEKTQAVVDELRAATKNDKISFFIADLSSFASIRKLAADFLAKYDRLDVLVNNAGAYNARRELTVDGYERTFATNHLGYFLVATLLLPALERAGHARIVNVSSGAHRSAPLDFNDLQAAKSYSSWFQYGRSKLANIYFTRELARRTAGKGITVNALHPGFVASDFLSKGGIWAVLQPIGNLFAVSVPAGARTGVYLASSPDVEGVTGKYFYKCKEARVKAFKGEDEAARRLWDESEKLVAAVP